MASLSPGLTQAVWEGHTRCFADITDPEDDEETIVEGGVMDVRLGRPDSQSKPEEPDAPTYSNTSSQSARSETHAEPEAEVSTSIGTDMEIGASDRGVRLQEESTDPPRHHLDAPPD